MMFQKRNSIVIISVAEIQASNKKFLYYNHKRIKNFKSPKLIRTENPKKAITNKRLSAIDA